MPDPVRRLLNWYDAHARVLPWRVAPGASVPPDPYRIWLSEIMLQQTTVAAVIPYFEAFTARWPGVTALSEAPLEDVLSAWAGLGYYARARNLHACACTVAEDHGGRFPDTEEKLLALPGIGAYTAAAIAAIAFGRKAVVVDGNVERVMARFHGVETPLPDAKPELRRLAAKLTPQKRPGDYAQAVMDLGATVCTPRSPDCGACPLKAACVAAAKGLAEGLPRKRPKAEKPTRTGIAFFVRRTDGAVLLRRRPPKGLLAKMLELPSVGWSAKSEGAPDLERDAPLPAQWVKHPGLVRHTFTHFHLELTVYEATVSAGTAAKTQGQWVPADALGTVGLPTVMRKVVDHVMTGDGPLFSKRAS